MVRWEYDTAVARVRDTIDGGCENLMLLRALIKMGLSDNDDVTNALRVLSESKCSDGGDLCSRRLNKLKYIPKSCYKANLHDLLLLAECKKKNVSILPDEKIISYFLERNIFYRKDTEKDLVIDDREGWRTIDTFFPFEPMRVGLQNVIEAFCALGLGDDPRLQEAWEMLDSCTDDEGMVRLSGTLTKSYLPKEKVG